MSTPRIFVVEDNPVDVLLFREALNNRGLTFSLELHSNGEDAAKAIPALIDAPELFVLDLNVPRVHGLELLRIIRACPGVSQVPVAILTSSQAPADRARSERYGADAYVVKPQGYHEFVTVVGSAIGGLLTHKASGNCSSSSHRFHLWRQTRSTHWSKPASVRCSNTSSPVAGMRRRVMRITGRELEYHLPSSFGRVLTPGIRVRNIGGRRS